MPPLPHRRRLLALLLALIATLGLVVPARANPELLVDMTTGDVLYADDAGRPWHPASLTKLMTAYVTFRAIAQGRISLDDRIVITRRAWNQAPAKSGLPIGASLNLKDALYVLLVKSANDVAWAIAQTLGHGSIQPFVDEMNRTAAEMGLTATHYDNPNGLPDPQQVTTARDLAILAMHIHLDYPAYLPIFGTRKVELDGRMLESDNDLLTSFAGTTGMKTGYICDSGLNIVATVNRGGRRLMVVLLGESSSRERGQRAAQLVLAALEGRYRDSGVNIMELPNDRAEPVGDMRSKICGKQAKSYLAARRKEFPLGLKGQPSLLTDKIPPVVYVAESAQVAGPVPLPRPRPAGAGIGRFAEQAAPLPAGLEGPLPLGIK